MAQEERPARKGPQQDPVKREQQKTRGYDTTKFASAGRNWAAGSRRAFVRRWFMPVCLWPREDRRRIAEGFA